MTSHATQSSIQMSAPGVLGRAASGKGFSKILSAAEIRTAANAQEQDADLTAIAALTTTSFGRSFLTQADASAARSTIELGTSATPSFAGLTLTGPVTGTSGVIQQRSGLTAQQYEIFGTFTSATSFESLCLKATSTAHQIGSTVGSGGGTNRPVQLGHFSSAGAFTSALSVASNGQITIPQTITFSNDLNFAGGAQLFFSGVGVVRWIASGVLRLTNALTTIGVAVDVSTDAVFRVRNRDNSANAAVVCSDITLSPSASRTLSTNGQFSIEMTSNTAGNLVYRGSDGTTRRMALTFV